MLYPDAEEYIDEILKIVEKCPESYKQKCFEILLEGYVTYRLKTLLREPTEEIEKKAVAEKEIRKESLIPVEILQRFKTTAKRLGVDVEKLENIFDFTTDPFTYRPFNPAGTNTAERARTIALLLAAKSYLSTGNWNADWKEIKSLCVDHNCYEPKHHAEYLQAGKGGIFKTVETSKSVSLSPSGITKAEAIVKKLADAE